MLRGVWAKIAAVAAVIGLMLAALLRALGRAEKRGADEKEREMKDADQKRAKEIRRRVDAVHTARDGRVRNADDTRGYRD